MGAALSGQMTVMPAIRVDDRPHDFLAAFCQVLCRLQVSKCTLTIATMSDKNNSELEQWGEELHRWLYYYNDCNNCKEDQQNIVERVSGLITKQPEVCKQQCCDGILPLQYAARGGGFPLQTLQQMVSCYPEALVAQDDTTGSTPLHFSCLFKASATEVFQLLTCPRAASLQNNEGNLPLHIYCDKDTDKGTIRYTGIVGLLVDAHPESAREPNKFGRLPLHLVSHCSEDWHLPLIRLLVESYGKGVSAMDSNGSRPLHLACSGIDFLPSLAVIRFLFEAYPRAAQQADNEGYTPLHILCKNERADILPVAGFLIIVCPESTAMLDEHGRAPLHHLCANERMGSRNYDSTTIQKNLLMLFNLLIDAFPGALETTNTEHHTPLHIAVHQRPLNVNVVRLLAPKCAAILEADDNHGEGTPLHLLCEEIDGDCRGLECLKALCVSEKAVKATDSHGRTPFHELCYHGASRECLETLLNKCAELPHLRDSKGRIPLHWAIEGAEESSLKRFHKTVSFLLELFPGGVGVDDNDGMTPLQLACEKDASLSLVYQLVIVDPVASLVRLGAG